MDRDNLRDILSEIDVLLFLAKKGKEEAKHFFYQMAVWGAYVSLNMTLGMFFHFDLWFYTLFLAFALSSISFFWERERSARAIVFPMVVWLLGYPVVFITYFTTHSIPWTVVATILFIFAASAIVYSRTNLPSQRRTPLAAVVGSTWGVLFGSFWLIAALYLLPDLDRNAEIFQVWISQMFGAGLFMSGVFHKVFFFLGLIMLFGFPVIYYFSRWWGLVTYDLVALSMALSGLVLYLRYDRGT